MQEQRFVQLVCEQTKKQKPDIVLHDSGVLVAQTIYGFDSSVMKKIEKFLREQKPELLHHQKFLENGTAERAKESGTALQILKQHSPDGKFLTMKDLRAEKEQLTIQKDAQYDTYHYFKDYHKELKTVCANVDSILGTEQEVQQHEQQRTRKYEQSL